MEIELADESQIQILLFHLGMEKKKVDMSSSVSVGVSNQSLSVEERTDGRAPRIILKSGTLHPI